MDAAEPASRFGSPQPSRCEPSGIANLIGNAASAGSGGHDEYPVAPPDAAAYSQFKFNFSPAAAQVTFIVRLEVDDDWSTQEQLHFAARDGDLTRARMLLADGADPNTFDDLNYTPLHYAVKHDHHDMVSLLLTYGADVNAHNESRIGNTPIREMASNCSLAMAKLLLDAGADPTIRGWMQLNALDVAKDRKRGDGPQVYKLLLQHAAKHA